MAIRVTPLKFSDPLGEDCRVMTELSARVAVVFVPLGLKEFH